VGHVLGPVRARAARFGRLVPHARRRPGPGPVLDRHPG
jgi:hypothetical protein